MGYTSISFPYLIMLASVSLLDRITADPRILAGKPVVRGLRISVEQLLKASAVGHTEADLLAEYPELELADFRAVLLFAADAVQE